MLYRTGVACRPRRDLQERMELSFLNVHFRRIFGLSLCPSAQRARPSGEKAPWLMVENPLEKAFVAEVYMGRVAKESKVH